MSDFVCDHPGCERTPADGPLFRVSPKGKGQPFVGLCGEHYKAEQRDFIAGR